MLSAELSSHSGGSLEDRNLREMQIAEAQPIRFQRGEVLRDYSYYFWQRIWLCPEKLSEAEFKSKRLSCLVEEISR